MHRSDSKGVKIIVLTVSNANNKRANEQGLSLVELAVAVVIMGILTAGVVKGHAVVENARVAQMITGVDVITKAHMGFVNTYGELPGDIDAPYVVSDCEPGNANFCFGGNQNGVIGAPTIDATVSTLGDDEYSMYWKHLAMAGFYPHIDVTVDVRNSSNLERGVTHPSIYPNSVVDIISFTRDGCTLECNEGPTLRVTRAIGSYDYTQPGQQVLWPMYAQRVDQKMDDGYPDTGRVQAEAAAANCDSGRVYQVSEKSRNCVMFFEIGY